MSNGTISGGYVGSGEVRREDKDRRRRVTKLLIILLLLLLLFFGLILAYFLSTRPAPINVKGVETLFSLYGFDRPLAVTADDNSNLYVSDSGHARFYVYDQDGNYLRRIGKDKGITRFFAPIGAKVDTAQKKVYIADFKRKAISVFSLSGKFLYRFPKNARDKNFGKLGFTPFAIELYKNKLYTTSYNGVFVFSKKGKLLSILGGRGKDVGRFDFPVALTIDKKDGSLYVADQLNRRVVAMDSKGIVKWVLGKPDIGGKANSFFGLPRGITIGPKGYIFVSDTFNHNIVVLDKKGALISVIGERGVEDGKFNFPEGLVFSKDRIYIADRENNRVQAIKINDYPEPDKKQKEFYRRDFVSGEH